jgi:hypothetical protein
MFFIQFDGTPRRDARTAPHAAGGRVNCWIERETLDEAVRVARDGIVAQGWIVDEPDEAYVVDETNYPPGQDGREYFEQALIDREVFVFYTYPEVDGESDDEDPGIA